MSSLVSGVIEDLRRRRLLVVAGALVLAIVAVPLLMLKKAEPAPAPATPATAASTGGLPGPDAALNPNKPLVSLAVLDKPSDLESFEPKDPFEPIDQVSTDGAKDTSAPAAGGLVESGKAAAASSPPSAGGGSGGSASPTEDGSGGAPGGGGSPPAPATPPSNPVTPSPPAQPPKQQSLTYAVDVAIRGPKGLRRYPGVPKLSLLPSQDNPLFVFLGVEDAGTKAVFLVDAKLRPVGQGEGTCTPSPEQCATLALAPGELQTLANDDGDQWTIQITQVRKVTVASAAAAARAAQKRRARNATARVGDTPIPRFIPPLITDLFTGGRS